MQLKSNWRLKYEEKGVKAVRRTSIMMVAAYIPCPHTDALDVITLILNHDFKANIGLHFSQVEDISELNDFLEDYHYEVSALEGLKVKGRK